ncbi:hypothetical protein Btru_023883 [Bulinus truncatus]|nr:hypothetical protein Btru_023883 [Bulinus truncatus]
MGPPQSAPTGGEGLFDLWKTTIPQQQPKNQSPVHLNTCAVSHHHINLDLFTKDSVTKSSLSEPTTHRLNPRHTLKLPS